jgi:two-component system response regulator PhoP
LIEDDPDLQDHIKQRLEKESYIVDVSGDGNEGYFFATEYHADAAIIDLGLPGMNGIEIIQILRKQGSVLPILVLTARSRWQEKVEGLEAGADDYFHFSSSHQCK